MAKKKTEYTPKLIFYADRIKLHMGFLSDSQLGCLIRMLTFHAVGMEAEADKLLKGCSDNVIKMLYADHRQYMDADNARYREICEKRRQTAIEREAYKRTNNHKCAQETTSDHKCAQESYNTNTKSNNNTNTKDSITESIKEEEEEEKVNSIKINSFVNIWNGIIRRSRERNTPCILKHINLEDLPEDAEERVNDAVEAIMKKIDSKTARTIYDNRNLKEDGRTIDNAAKWYIIKAVENMSNVRMKPRDTSFGSFQWLFGRNAVSRITKLYNGDIQ